MKACELKANRSMRAQNLSVRWSVVDIVLTSGPKKNYRLRECKRFLSCTATEASQALVPVGALPEHWLGLLRFSL